MTIDKIKVNSDTFNSTFELEFKSLTGNKYCPQIVFGRNGMGKTTLASYIYDEKFKMVDGEVSDCFLKNNETLSKHQLYQEGIYVFGEEKDFSINFASNGVPPIIITNDKLEELDREINTFESSLYIKFDNLARTGGSNANPNGTLARRLSRYFNITSATFDSSRKSQFKSKGEIGFLKDIRNAAFYKELSGLGKLGLRPNLGLDIKEKFPELDSNQQETLMLLLEALIRLDWLDLDKIISELEKVSNEINLKKIERENLVAGTREEAEEYLEEINKLISFIFFDENRLKFIPSDSNLYRIKSRTKIIENLSVLSTAEKNIISLCMFFIKVKEDIKNKKSVTIVLDDPISSTDYDNKIGLYSFISSRISDLYKSKKSVRVIILSHDMETVYNFEKLLDEIDLKPKTAELIDFKLAPNSTKTVNFYSKQLKLIYEFARGERDDLEMYMGNTVRRVLEAYSTFNYKTGPTYLMSDEFLLNRIGSKKGTQKLERYQYLLYRLWLNGDSHSKEISQSVVNEFGSSFSLNEKKNITKVLLQFLNELDPYHLIKHLNDEHIGETIKSFKFD